MGAACTRHSLRPLIVEDAMLCKPRTRVRRENVELRARLFEN
jgi:hypothetical protein